MQFALKDAFQSADGSVITASYEAEFSDRSEPVSGRITLPAVGTRNEWLKQAGAIICERHRNGGLLSDLQEICRSGDPIEFDDPVPATG